MDDYAKKQELKRKQEYKEYYKQRLSVGCKPLDYLKWLEYKLREG